MIANGLIPMSEGLENIRYHKLRENNKGIAKLKDYAEQNKMTFSSLEYTFKKFDSDHSGHLPAMVF